MNELVDTTEIKIPGPSTTSEEEGGRHRAPGSPSGRPRGGPTVSQDRVPDGDGHFAAGDRHLELTERAARWPSP